MFKISSATAGFAVALADSTANSFVAAWMARVMKPRFPVDGTLSSKAKEGKVNKKNLRLLILTMKTFLPILKLRIAAN